MLWVWVVLQSHGMTDEIFGMHCGTQRWQQPVHLSVLCAPGQQMELIHTAAEHVNGVEEKSMVLLANEDNTKFLLIQLVAIQF
jgi:hypothetical protein